MENRNPNPDSPNNPTHGWQHPRAQEEEYADSPSGRVNQRYSRQAPNAHQSEYQAHSTGTSSEVFSTESDSSNMQSYGHPQFTSSQYPQNLRVQFSGQYLNQAAGSSSQEMYQPTQSYERISPVDDYRDVTSGSDVLPSYSIQSDNNQLISTADHVDTTAMRNQSYPVHLMTVDGENRVVAVQRIISPDEGAVSQSTMAIRPEFPEGSQQSLIAVVPSHSQADYQGGPSQSSSIPKASLSMIVSSSHINPHSSLVAFPSTSEVSTTAGSPSMQHTRMDHSIDGEPDQPVSSINPVYAVQSTPNERCVRSDSANGEPDTTQGDVDDFPRHRAIHSGHHLNDDGDDNGLLHSTVVGSTVNTSDDVMDASLDTSHISHESVGSSELTSSSDSGLDRTVDSSIGPHQASPPPYSTHHHMGQSEPHSHVTQSNISQSGILLAHPGHGTVSLNLGSSDLIHNINGYTVSNLQYAGMNNQQPSGSGSLGYFVPVDLQHMEQGSSMILPNGTVIDGDDKENVPDDQGKLRKSDRIAHMEADSFQRRPPRYISKPYNAYEIWCEECMTSYNVECPLHKLISVPDKMVMSRAWSSLPSLLSIFRLGDTQELGVFTKRSIAKQTLFGPFVGELKDDRNMLTNTRFLLRLERENGEYKYFNTADENLCNWMMFVRPAENYEEQNLVAYQYGYDIFFTVIKNVEPKQELKVWYAAHYAEQLGVALHTRPEDEDNEGKWPCNECPKRFKTVAQLQNHLTEHEEGYTVEDVEGEEYDATGMKTVKRKPISPSAQLPKKRRFIKSLKENGERKVFQSWKKRTTNLYLTKTLKKYQKRHDPEMIKRTLKSLYKRKGKDTGGNEWVCTHCDLTFDNSSLLNLHTLTHAAEDVGLPETEKQVTISTGEDGQLIISGGYLNGSLETGDNVMSLQSALPACPVCHKTFPSKRELIEHASEHATTRKPIERSNKCSFCWKCFSTLERLQKHMLCHGDEDTKPMQCKVCFKRFMNNSALSCHMKTHSNKKYYECVICHLGFDHSPALKSHVKLHEVDGLYNCPMCNKQFDDFNLIRKHIRGFHSAKQYPCSECDKVFPRADKLKLHKLKHSSHRDFMCETCGRQFKRKDKLKEHMKRMHSAERELRSKEKSDRPPSIKRFVPKVQPTDYHRFIYKCHSCLLGFKRRGMLVNHLAKRHPDIKPDQVPELNLPILKTQKDYYCQYCDKVYKSSSKRKVHIIKNHPGAELPLSSRNKAIIPEIPGLPNPTYSQTVGSITTMPQSCDFCHKQYASKAKLMQHQKKKHPEYAAQLFDKPTRETQGHEEEILVQGDKPQEVHVYETVQAAILAPGQEIPTADLLTQAMSELTQSLGEYRTQGGEYRIAPNGHTLVQAATHIPIQHSTIELSHLGQALGHAQYATQGHIVQAAASPGQPQAPAAVPVTIQAIPVSAVAHQAISPQTVVSSGQTTIHVPVSGVGQGQTFVQRAWTSYANYR